MEVNAILPGGITEWTPVGSTLRCQACSTEWVLDEQDDRALCPSCKDVTPAAVVDGGPHSDPPGDWRPLFTRRFDAGS